MLETFSSFRWQDVLDILIVAVVFYNIILLIRGTRAVQMLIGLSVLMGVYFVAQLVGLHAVSWVLQNFLGAVVLVIIILFQPEFRRALANVGKAPLFRLFNPDKEEQVLHEVMKAAQQLSSRRVGALIAIERESGLGDYVESGLRVDARVLKEVLFSVFLPGSPIHDGAVLIQGERIAQAGCFLPLSHNPQLPKELGTRHRAAVGLTEETDAVVVVVSEETGAVSLAFQGALTRDLDAAGLQGRLEQIFSFQRGEKP